MADVYQVEDKYPGETKVYGCNWRAASPAGPALAEDEDVETSTWAITSAATTPPLTLPNGPGGTFDADGTLVEVAGGRTGHAYFLANTVHTTKGQDLIAVLELRVAPVPT